MNELISKKNILPQGWISTEFKNVINKVTLTGKKLKKSRYIQTGKFPVIDQGCDLIGGFTNEKKLILDCKLPVIVFGDHTRIVKYIDQEFVPGADGIKVLEPKTIFNPKLFYYFTKILLLPNKGYARHYQYLEKSIIHIPPLNEQKRIVTKIESIFKHIDTTRKSLDVVNAHIKQCRQSVLRDVFDGKLVSQNPNDESVETFLQKIQKDFNNHIVIKKNILPKGWVETTIGSVCSKPQYGWTTSASDKGSLQLLRTTDITSGHINWNTIPFCKNKPKDIEKYLLHDGDIVISRAGSVGFSYLLKNPQKAVFASYLIRFKPYINEKFFLYFLHSPMYWNAIMKKTAGIALANVNATKLRQISITIPPLNEQKRIVIKIESIFAKIDIIEKQIVNSIVKLDYIKKSTLKKAFEGKLVLQDPNDESAEILLQKIQQQKEQITQKSRKTNVK